MSAPRCPDCGAVVDNFFDHITACPPIDDDDDMFDGDEPERDEVDHQAARFDHAHDLRKHG